MEAIKAYLERIKGIPVLTKQEEEKILRRALRGSREARRKIINANLKLVVSIAKHYNYFDLALMDLIAEGNIGLMRSINKFKISKGFRFSTYAAWWIKQAITRAIVDQGKTIRIPVYMNEQMSRYNKAKENLRQKLKRDPSRGELAKKLGISVHKVADTEMWMQKKSSIDAPVGETGESQLGDFLPGDEYANTDKEVERIFEKEHIGELLSALNPRERQILSLRFGLADGKTFTLTEVAKVLKVSRERIRQIEKEALKKIKKNALDEQKREE